MTETTNWRIGRPDLHRVLSRLSQLDFFKGFSRTGRARYVRDAGDDLRHGVEFGIDRRNVFALFVTPVLTIDHLQARNLKVAGIRPQQSHYEAEFPFLGVALGHISEETLGRRDEYGLVQTVVMEKIGERDLFRSGGYWRSMNELDELAQQIDSDLESVATPFFRGRDTVAKVIDWLGSDPWAGGTSKRIDIVCLLAVQGRQDEAVRMVNSWTEETSSPMELRFAEYFRKQVGEQ